MITKFNQEYNSAKYKKSLRESRERGFTDGTKIPKITITAKITKITNQGSEIGKHNKSLEESRERGFTNVTKIPKTTLIQSTPALRTPRYYGHPAITDSN